MKRAIRLLVVCLVAALVVAYNTAEPTPSVHMVRRLTPTPIATPVPFTAMPLSIATATNAPSRVITQPTAPADTPTPMATWVPTDTPVPAPPALDFKVDDIEFVDALHGWILGDNTLRATSDGGKIGNRFRVIRMASPHDRWRAHLAGHCASPDRWTDMAECTSPIGGSSH